MLLCYALHTWPEVSFVVSTSGMASQEKQRAIINPSIQVVVKTLCELQKQRTSIPEGPFTLCVFLYDSSYHN